MVRMHEPKQCEKTHAILHPHVDNRTPANDPHQIAVLDVFGNASEEESSSWLASPPSSSSSSTTSSSSSSLNTKGVGVAIQSVVMRRMESGRLLRRTTTVSVSVPVSVGITASILIAMLTVAVVVGISCHLHVDPGSSSEGLGVRLLWGDWRRRGTSHGGTVLLLLLLKPGIDENLRQLLNTDNPIHWAVAMGVQSPRDSRP